MSGLRAAVARVQRSAFIPTLASAALIAAAAALVLFSNRGMYLFQDEWDYITTRNHFTAFNLLAPQNQNLLVTTALSYQALIRLFGVGDYLPYRLMPAFLLVVLGVLTYVYARRYIGRWWALLPLALIVVNPAAEIVIWPFQIGQPISLACGLGALIVLDSAMRGWPRAVLVAGLLLVCVASSSFGVPLVAVVAYDRVLRRDRRIELLYVLPAALFYTAWRQRYGSISPYENTLGWAQLNAAMQRAVEIANGHFAYFLGLARWPAGAFISRVGLIAAFALLCWAVFGPQRVGRERILAIAGGLATFWPLLAWGRAVVPGLESDDRYIFGTQALLVLLAVHLAPPVASALRGARIAGRPARWLPVAAGILVAVVAVQAVHSNSQRERLKGYLFRQQGQAMRGQVAALDVLTAEQRRRVPFVLNGLTNAFPRPSDLIYKFVHAPNDREVSGFVAGLPPEEAAFADQRLLTLFTQTLVPGQAAPATGKTRPSVTSIPGAGARVVRARGGCVRMSGASDTSNADVRPDSHGLLIRNAGGGLGEAFVRRFAATWTGPARQSITPSTAVAIRFPPDRSTVPWHLRVLGRNMVICTLA